MTPPAPRNVSLPTIGGETVEGETLQASTGTWSGDPSSYAYQWQECGGSGGSCSNLSGATNPTYQLTSSDVGQTMRVMVAPSGVASSETVTSPETAEVLPDAGTAAVAWGNNAPTGQLGTGYNDHYEVAPALVRDISGIRSMVSTDETSYALLDTGTVRAWGRDGQGELGNGEVVHGGSDSPVAVVEATSGGKTREMTNVTALAAAFGAYAHAMALVDRGQSGDEVMTWGASAFGERGNGEYDRATEEHALEPRDVAIPVPALEGKHIVAIATGGNSDFALQEEDGGTTLWAWGSNWHGKLGIGKAGEDECKGDGGPAQECVPTPQQVDLPPDVKVKAISSGKQAAYALLSDGRVLAWGENAYGQLGDGSDENSDVPIYVCALKYTGSCQNKGPYLEGVKAISGGEKFALALLEDSDVVGWGINGYGDLGSTEANEPCKGKSIGCRRSPKVIEGLEGVTAIAAGSNYGLALVNDGEHRGQVYSWGSNEHGQLGDGKEEGPETCGEKTIKRGKTNETFVKQCSRKPLEIGGLSDVAGIAAVDGADPDRGSYGHSFAFLQSGAGPAPLLTVASENTRGRDALKVDWSVASPEAEYKIRWKAMVPEDSPLVEEIGKIEAEMEEDENIGGEFEEMAETAEGGGAAEGAEAERARYAGRVEELKARQESDEKDLEEEYPASKIERVAAAERCKEGSQGWCYTITGVSNKKDLNEPLQSGTWYQVTLNVAGGGQGDATMRIDEVALP